MCLHAPLSSHVHHTEILCKRISPDGGSDDRQTTGLCGEHINLIGALAHIAEQTLNGIGGLNVSVHGGRKGIKGQEVLFILSQAAGRLWIAFAVFGA